MATRSPTLVWSAVLVGAWLVAAGGASVAGAQQAPELVFDPTWPKTLPNNWKIGGVTGLAVDRDDNVWVYNRPNDLTNIELHAELDPPLALLLRAAAVDDPHRQGRQRHRLVRRAAGARHGRRQPGLRLYRPGHRPQIRSEDRQVVGEIARAPEREDGGPVGVPRRAPQPGQGGRGPVAAFLPQPAPDAAAVAAQAERRRAAFRAKYPPTTPMIVGSIEEIRVDEADNEIYVADNYLGGRVMVFDLDTFAFKRGWGAYGKPLAEISINDADHGYTPNGPMPKEFVGHLTLNFSHDGLVYAADRNANRIHVTDKQGKFIEGVRRWHRAPASAAPPAASRSRPTRSSGSCTSPT